MEIDFLITKSNITIRLNISLIEVKSGKNYTLVSINKFRKKYNEQLVVPCVIHIGPFKEEDDLYFFLYICYYYCKIFIRLSNKQHSSCS